MLPTAGKGAKIKHPASGGTDEASIMTFNPKHNITDSPDQDVNCKNGGNQQLFND